MKKLLFFFLSLSVLAHGAVIAPGGGGGTSVSTNVTFNLGNMTFTTPLTLSNDFRLSTNGQVIVLTPGLYDLNLRHLHTTNNLAKAGVSFKIEPGAHIFYKQTTTNENAGIFDYRYVSGASTNVIVNEGEITFLGSTNQSAHFGAYLANEGTLGAFVVTNSNSEFRYLGPAGKLTSYQLNLNTHFFHIGDCAYVSIVFDKLFSPLYGGQTVNVPDVDFGPTADVPDAIGGGYWEAGETHIKGNRVQVSNNSIYANEPGTTTNSQEQMYLDVDYLDSAVYVNCRSPGYKLWIHAKEIGPSDGSAASLKFYGGGSMYVVAEKLFGWLEIVNGGTTNPPGQFWVWAQKQQVPAGTYQVNIGTNHILHYFVTHLQSPTNSSDFHIEGTNSNQRISAVFSNMTVVAPIMNVATNIARWAIDTNDWVLTRLYTNRNQRAYVGGSWTIEQAVSACNLALAIDQDANGTFDTVLRVGHAATMNYTNTFGGFVQPNAIFAWTNGAGTVIPQPGSAQWVFF